jgi:hypothetical protein
MGPDKLKVFTIPKKLSFELIQFYKKQECYTLKDLKDYGAVLRKYVGIYFLFYNGDYPLYQCISELNQKTCEFPIYVGKAVESGRRKGDTSKNTQNLYSRLNEHVRSLNQCSGLELNEFRFKVIATSSELVSWSESTMIQYFQPAWNQIIDGFGIHDPGAGRAQQRRSVWDCLHPGRLFTKKLPNAVEISEEEFKKRISDSCKRFRERIPA